MRGVASEAMVERCLGSERGVGILVLGRDKWVWKDGSVVTFEFGDTRSAREWKSRARPDLAHAARDHVLCFTVE